MRQGQQNRRGRGRGNNNHNQTQGNNHHSRKPQNLLSKNYESNGPDVKIRGTAQHIAEKYMHLARDASSSGDFITAENYLQHAEHYNRIIMAAQTANAQYPAHQPGGPQPGGDGMNGHIHNPRLHNGHDQQPDFGEANEDMRPYEHQSEAEISDALPQPVPQASPEQSPPGEEANGRHRRRRRPSGGPEGRKTADGANGHVKGANASGEGGVAAKIDSPPDDLSN